MSPPMSNEEDEFSAEFDRAQLDFQPWIALRYKISADQIKYQDFLRKRLNAIIEDQCFISRQAAVFARRFFLGKRSYIAGGVIVRGNVTIGSNSSINAYAHIAGKVSIGSDVRVAGMVAIYGFNHIFDDVSVPISKQGITSVGVVIEDGVWIGTNTVILDGVTIGNNCVVAAGSVVTKNFEPFQILGGNPARVLRSRV